MTPSDLNNLIDRLTEGLHLLDECHKENTKLKMILAAINYNDIPMHLREACEQLLRGKAT